MEFRILGPVEMHIDGQACELGSPKERCVLAMLLWRLGRPVSADALVDGIWGDNPPVRARTSLHSYVSRLRNSLKGTTSSLRWRSGFYTLDVDPGAVDIHQFRDLREQARAIGESGDDEQASMLLRQAEELWRGEPLAGLSGDWANRTRLNLISERFRTTCDRIEAELRLGRHADLITQISDLADEHPFDEALVKYLMIALYRCGRATEAMETYRHTRRRLIEEIGKEPGAELRDLHQRMLNEDPDLNIKRPIRPQHRGAPPNNLPRDNPDFTGRVAELGKLLHAIDTEHARETVTVVAITGMPGAGKSTFAVHAAHLLRERYPERFYLDLHTHHHIEEPMDATSGLGVLLRTRGVPPERIPAGLEERAALWRSELVDHRALIVLDDASEVSQIQPLLPGNPGCLVLITCRRRVIGIPGIVDIALDTMRVDEAVSLFARIVGNERVRDEAAVAEVVELCKYLPLKIQLEGSRFRQHPTWSISALAAQLARSRFNRTEIWAEEREVANSLDLSYRYLSSEQQRMFRQLALHPTTSFSVYAVAAASGSESLDGAERVLESLLEYHLLEEPELGRYKFHDLIREYAWRRSQADDTEVDRKQVVHRILDYYLCLVARAASITYPFHRRMGINPLYAPAALPPLNSGLECQQEMEAEQANVFCIIRYAAGNNWPKHAALLPHLLAQFLDSWGLWVEAKDLHQLAIRGWGDVPDGIGEARSAADLCLILGRSGCFTEALEYGNSALATFKAHGDKSGEAEVLDCLGLVLWEWSRYSKALEYHERALKIWRELHDRHGEANALLHSAGSLSRTSKYQESLNLSGKALAIFRETGDRHGEGRSINNIAQVLQRLGRYNNAIEHYRQALVISRDIGDRQGEAIVLNNIGEVLQRTGRFNESLDYYRSALRIYRDIGDRRCEADALNNIGAVFQKSGNPAEALVHHQKALVMAHELTEPYQEAWSLLHMGNAHMMRRRYSLAAADFRAALDLSITISDAYQEGLALQGLGSAILRSEGPTAAAEQWRKALTVFEAIGVPEADAVRDSLDTLR